MVPIIYSSDSQALSALETFVHLQDDAKHIPYVSIKLQIPSELILDVESITSIPNHWRSNHQV